MCIFFFCAGNLVIPHLGVENDEALFAIGLYPPRGELSDFSLHHTHVPTMIMSYVGALKTWIYWPILRWSGTGMRALREPMLVVGTASLWVFFFLMRRIAGERAALIGCALLAADAMYLLTVCFDWGPVALQHLLIAGGALLLLRFAQEERTAALAGGCFLLGLAVWDKALALWILSGIGVATLIVYPRTLWRLFTLRRLAIAILFFALGALPLLDYNIRQHGGTFSGNFQKDLEDVPGKAAFLVNSSGGRGLFGWMTAEAWETPSPHQPLTTIERAADEISSLAGHPRSSLFPFAFLLALVAAPFSGRCNFRIVLFCLIALIVAWIQMAINFQTGGSIHHTILLWPLPQAIIGVSLAGASLRLGRAGIPAVAVISAVVAISGALVLNEYYVVMVRYGGAQAWNDGIFALSRYLKATPARQVVCMDWGLIEPLRMLNRGSLRLESGTDQVAKPVMDDADRAAIERQVAQPGNLFLAHTPAFEFFKGQNGKVIDFATSRGYQREVLATISDTFGRPVYEVYRFR